MQEISNRTLAMMLVAAIIISLAGTFYSLSRLSKTQTSEVSGYAAATGKVNLTIVKMSECFINTNVSFGTSTLSDDVHMTTEEAAPPGTTFYHCDSNTEWNCTGMEVENIGNLDVNVSLQSDRAGTSFFSVPGGNVSFWVMDGNRTKGEKGSCRHINWTYNLSLSTEDIFICGNLTKGVRDENGISNDTLTIEFAVDIKKEETPGEKYALLTVTCVETIPD